MTTRRIPINHHKAGLGTDPGTRSSQAVEAEVDRQDDTWQEPAPREATDSESGSVTRGCPPEMKDDRLAAVTAERDAAIDALLRLRAEFENFRKRSQREMAETRARAQADLLLEFLPLLDNLDRALEVAQLHDEGKLVDGVRLTSNQFVDLLRRVGVQEVETLGKPFDPEVHEAMFFGPSDKPEGIITAVVSRGYRTGDRVLRPARVAVSSGPEAEGAH